jgi:glycosyltransferase involved in cell wall biosynthesis
MHAHNFEGLLAALAVRRLTGVPVVYHVHNAMGLELHTYFRSRLGRWAGMTAGRWVDEHLPRRADRCIVLDEGAVDYFRRRGVKSPRVVAPGIDYEPGDAATARARLGAGPLIVYSGNLDPYQDLDLLLEAFGHVVEVRPDAKLVLSTNAAPQRRPIETDSPAMLDRVEPIVVSDFGTVRDLLAAADVAVCPRTNCLGFPIKLLNYMAAGKAMVVSEGSACGVRHLENGWIVDNGDTDAMAAAILALLGNAEMAERLGESARRTAASQYSWADAGDAIEEIYLELVGRRG